MTTRPTVGIGLMLMSFGSGCVDVLSFRFLGETLPSAMTGNVALLGLRLGRGEVSAAIPGLCALAGFLTGLLIGARLLRGSAGHGAVALTLVLQAALLLGLALAFVSDQIVPWRYALIGLAAGAMGLQSTVAHHARAGGISTTYFTGTLATIAFTLAETPQAIGAKAVWPLLAFLMYLCGALAGGCYAKGALMDPLAALPFAPFAVAVTLAIIVARTGPRAKAA